jgi:molybdopterin-guanine dinucleotide biosynthesis protein A
VASAAILAGGRATRLAGADKGSLIVEGRSVRSRQLEVLASVSDDLLIVERPGRMPVWPADLTVSADRVRIVFDREAGCGPLAGLETALREARHDRVVVLAGDMPFVTATFLSHLVAVAVETGADAVVPRTESGYHPLCGVYTRRILPVVARRLADRRLKMVDLVGEVRVRDITEAELNAFGQAERLLANVNTAAEHAALGDPGKHTA